MSVSRRQFLQGSGIAGLSAATLATFPASIQKALAIPANNQTGTIQDVEHVVILMQENRSFDNYFGTLRGVRGFGDRFTIPQTNNRSVWQQLDKDDNIIMPYHLDQQLGNAQRVKGTPHSWVDARDAWDKGRMSHWPKYKQPQSMGYYQREELTFQFALAEAFTVCDAYFCSLHGGTNCNRMFFWTGTNGATANPPQVVVNNFWDELEPGMTDGGYKWTTYPERLQQAGISWKVYQNMPDNFTDNCLVGFEAYRKANIASGQPVYHNWDESYVAPAYDPSLDAKAPLYKGIANTMPDGGMLGSFKQDILDNKLPQVSWVVAPEKYSEHPGPSSPIQGAWYTQEVLDALTANPEVWSKTVLIVNFDENDGFFDHLPSPCAPSYVQVQDNAKWYGKTTLPQSQLTAEYYSQMHVPEADDMPLPDNDVYGPGPRVPMYIISPWTKGGWVNSQNFDHTSILRFLEARFGVQETNISPYRRAMFGDLTSAFNFKEPNNEQLPTLAGRQTQQHADSLRTAQEKLPPISVPANQTLPKQETGYKPSRALPYRLHTTAHVNATGVGLIFANTGTEGCVFHVYDKLNLADVPRRYAVEPNKQLNDIWALTNGNYDLWVLSNNGYHRHFVGNTASPNQAEIRVCYDIANGNVYVDLMNQSASNLTFVVTPKAYFGSDATKTQMVQAGQEIQLHWDLKDSGRWYDFEVTLKEDASWKRRFAGRVETGEHGITDPAMGQEV
ncbi:phosphocholine-specific phospholipase C [Moraxella atlantae]|uniref:phospholipase C n=1 Tax=Faucicola atlantae TaxID=34059 RepID=A0A378Q451_9GAMM|nr:phospholipase C, phosphocholine-specific [Moraxella atlantae]OPH37303.1 phospholipase C, phosphocholine-specific [Moraxella atlantae]STY95519.1 Non-hemolytic phospholipase C precursor [Moraxella atlantae]